MKKEDDIVEIHIKHNKTTDDCKLYVNGDPAGLIFMLASAMKLDNNFKEIILTAYHILTIDQSNELDILDHKN